MNESSGIPIIISIISMGKFHASYTRPAYSPLNTHKWIAQRA